MKKLPVADALEVLGVLTVAGGVAWIYLPAGVIVLGLAVAAAGVLMNIPDGPKKRRPS